MDSQLVLLVTLWGNKNYGNRLQTIALKKIISDKGFRVVCIPNNNETIKSRIKRVVKESLGRLGFYYFRIQYLNSLRVCAIKKSCRRLFEPKTKQLYQYTTRERIDYNDYSCAITGSDQVWHKWTKNPNELPYFYLEFMPPKKRISYAASFGFEIFPETDKEEHYKGLRGMRFISCREESGCKLVEEATGKPGTLVLDPTLCVERSYWDSLEEKPRYIKERPYLLVYMLGKRDEYYDFIKKYAQLNDFEIIDLHDTNRKDVWKTTIGGFIWLVHHAEMICTDSFHCTVFSILYHRPFQIFRRRQKGFEHMFDRIETLLKLAGLENCEFDGGVIKKENIDYDQVENRINIEKEKSIHWLRNVLEEVTGS